MVLDVEPTEEDLKKAGLQTLIVNGELLVRTSSLKHLGKPSFYETALNYL
jgi:hypothetical protein